jgi:hypothetical protein
MTKNASVKKEKCVIMENVVKLHTLHVKTITVVLGVVVYQIVHVLKIKFVKMERVNVPNHAKEIAALMDVVKVVEHVPLGLNVILVNVKILNLLISVRYQEV